SADWEDVVDDVLARLGAATDTSRVYVFRTSTDEAGILRTSQLREWCAPGIAPEIDNDALQGQSWDEAGLARWVGILSEGGIVHGDVATFPAAERDTLDP